MPVTMAGKELFLPLAAGEVLLSIISVAEIDYPEKTLAIVVCYLQISLIANVSRRR